MQNFQFARLIALHPDVSQKEYDLINDVCTIGRQSDVCDLHIQLNTVSRIHARIERQGSHYLLSNLSRNHTFVNGLPIDSPTILKDQDALGFSEPGPMLRFVDADPTVFIQRRLQCNPAQRQFTFDNQPLNLTPTQYKLLYFLFQNRGQLCAHDKCEEIVWGLDPIIETGALHRLVADIRGEFRHIDPQIDPIETRRGLGYVLRMF